MLALVKDVGDGQFRVWEGGEAILYTGMDEGFTLLSIVNEL